MKVLVTGSRHSNDPYFVFDVLDEIHRATPIALLIHGDADGVDSFGDAWAENNGVQPVACRALWDRQGWYKSAGPRRNSAMVLLQPDLVVAFPGGSGTADMVTKALAAGIPVRHIAERPTLF